VSNDFVQKKQRWFLVAVSVAELGPAEAPRAHGISTRMACYYHKTAIKEISTGMTITHGGKRLEEIGKQQFKD